MRQTLLACYQEFRDILQQMAITHVPKLDVLHTRTSIYPSLNCLTVLGVS